MYKFTRIPDEKIAPRYKGRLVQERPEERNECFEVFSYKTAGERKGEASGPSSGPRA